MDSLLSENTTDDMDLYAASQSQSRIPLNPSLGRGGAALLNATPAVSTSDAQAWVVAKLFCVAYVNKNGPY